MSDNVRNLLDELRGAGQFDSVGGFTLDAAHAREKMKLFQLAEPHMYVLLLVSAAVQSQAGSFDISTRSGHVVIEFSGEPFTRLGTMMELYGSLHASLDARTRDLALAVNAATALDAHCVIVESGDTRLMVTEEGEKTESAPTGPRTRVHVFEGTAWQAGKWLAVLGDEPVEVGLLRNHCCYASLSLTFNHERRLDTTFNLGRPQVVSRIASEDSESDTGLRVHVTSLGGWPRWSRTSLRLNAALAYGGEAGRQMGFVFVVNGVNYFRSAASLGLDVASRGIVVCPRLLRDLSGAGLVEDEVFAEVVRLLAEEIAEMRAVIKQAEEDAAPPQVEMLSQIDVSQPAGLKRFRRGYRHLIETSCLKQGPQRIDDLQSHWDEIEDLQAKMSRSLSEASDDAVTAVAQVKGLLEAVRGNYDEAIRFLERALQRRPGSTRHMLATVRRSQGRVEEAMALHQTILDDLGPQDRTSDSARGLERVADTRLALGQVGSAAVGYATAARVWRHATREGKDAVPALDGLGACLQRLGRPEFAIRVWRRALRLRNETVPNGDVEMVFRSRDLRTLMREQGLLRHHHLGLWLILSMSGDSPEWRPAGVGLLLAGKSKGVVPHVVFEQVTEGRRCFRKERAQDGMTCFEQALGMLAGQSLDHPYLTFVTRYYARCLRLAGDFARADVWLAKHSLVLQLVAALKRVTFELYGSS